MTVSLVDLVKIYATNTGTGAFVLGAAVPSFRGSEALTDGETYGYSVRQGSNYEVGTGVFDQGSGTLGRDVQFSSAGGAQLNLSPNAIITFPALAAQIGRPGPEGPAGPTGPEGPSPDISGLMVKAANLSDLVDVPTARGNLGLGSMAEEDDAPSDGKTYGRKNAAWSEIISAITRTSITATGGQTSFAVTYTVGYAAVYLNGVLLNAADYTATSGTAIVLASAATVGDLVDVFAAPVGGFAGLTPANNLSDVANVATARSNLGLGYAVNTDLWTGTSAAKAVTPAAVLDSAVPQTLADGATVTPNFGAGFNFEWTIGGNRTLANPTNAKSGQSGTIKIVQDATGSRVITYGNNWRFPGGSATGGLLSTAANAVDVLAFSVGTDGKIYATISKAFAA